MIGEENAPEIEFNHRRSLGYFIMFSINFYICLVVCIHGSTMSNEDIESHGFNSDLMALESKNKLTSAIEKVEDESVQSWELEVFWEIVMAIVMFDPLGGFSDG